MENKKKKQEPKFITEPLKKICKKDHVSIIKIFLKMRKLKVKSYLLKVSN